MASVRNPNRPMSPHLQVWKWGPHMLVSILHRVTGSGMATVGSVLLVWWLAALASGPEAYAAFLKWFTGDYKAVGYVVGIGLTLSVFQHAASGVRHFVMDTGAGFELRTNKLGALATMSFSITATALFWFYLVGVK